MSATIDVDDEVLVADAANDLVRAFVGMLQRLLDGVYTLKDVRTGAEVLVEERLLILDVSRSRNGLECTCHASQMVDGVRSVGVWMALRNEELTRDAQRGAE